MAASQMMIKDKKVFILFIHYSLTNIYREKPFLRVVVELGLDQDYTFVDSPVVVLVITGFHAFRFAEAVGGVPVHCVEAIGCCFHIAVER